jgi:hypothetical protein
MRNLILRDWNTSRLNRFDYQYISKSSKRVLEAIDKKNKNTHEKIDLRCARSGFSWWNATTITNKERMNRTTKIITPAHLLFLRHPYLLFFSYQPQRNRTHQKEIQHFFICIFVGFWFFFFIQEKQKNSKQQRWNLLHWFSWCANVVDFQDHTD